MSDAAPSALVDLVGALTAHVAATDNQYAANYARGATTHPIPFFGRLHEADILTVGLNPSSTEFAAGRRWPASFDSAGLAGRLLGYFDDPLQPPHTWFGRWEEALVPLGASYRAGAEHRAAHLDLSPRATVGARVVADRMGFERMIADDMPWALRFLAAASRVRLVLMAGAVTGRYYMNEFVARHLPPEMGRLEGSTRRPPGCGKVLWHTLVLGARRIPVYFCSSSPSDRFAPTLLRDRIAADATTLRTRFS